MTGFFELHPEHAQQPHRRRHKSEFSASEVADYEANRAKTRQKRALDRKREEQAEIRSWARSWEEMLGPTDPERRRLAMTCSICEVVDEDVLLGLCEQCGLAPARV